MSKSSAELGTIYLRLLMKCIGHDQTLMPPNTFRAREICLALHMDWERKGETANMALSHLHKLHAQTYNNITFLGKQQLEAITFKSLSINAKLNRVIQNKRIVLINSFNSLGK